MPERWTESKIEEHLREAVADSTPDIWDQLMDEIRDGQNETPAGEDRQDIQEWERVITNTRRRRRKNWYKAVAGLAAALMIFAGAFTIYQKGQDKVFAVVSIDVNPSVELFVNDAQEIVAAEALNEDGTVILDDMKLDGLDINTACNALAGSMLKHGYLSELSNSIMVSVWSEDENKGHEIEHQVSGNLNNYMENSRIDGAVLGQYVERDEELAAFAKANNISDGKAWLIRNLLATDGRNMTEESLLKLSTQELILLGQERGISFDDFYGSADKSGYISEDDAKQIAFQDAGVADYQPDKAEIEFDCDDGVITYDVDFTVNGQEYEYEINARTGEIVDHEVDVDDDDADDDDDDADDDDDDADDDDDDADDHNDDDDDHDDDDDEDDD